MMKMTRSKYFIALFCLLAILSSAELQNVRAQGSAQVQILGVPGLLDNPSLATQVNRFDTGQYPIQFVYTATTNREESFRFLFTIEKDGNTLAEVESEPVTFTPGVYLYNNFRDNPQIRFSQTLRQIISSLPGAARSSFNSGLFPEGNYTLIIEAVPEDPFSMISTLPGITQFTVSYGQPPLLVSPPPESDVIQPFPVFTWSPVSAPAEINVEYEIRIVEILHEQQPEQAMEGVEFPVVEEVVVNLTSFMMTPMQLQLEPGSTYAWQVTARDAFGEYPFRNDGRSEIGVFYYSGLPGDGESLADLQNVVLVPGFAELRDIFIDESDSDAFSYTLDGSATLDIGNPTAVNVNFSDLRIQKTGLDNPVVLGGTLNGNVQEAELPFTQAASVVEFLDLSWEFGGPFELSGNVVLPGTGAVTSSGSILWTPQGLQGELTADAPDGLRIGQNPVEAELTSVTARFPQANISAEGSLALFGDNTECQIGTISIGQTGSELSFDCNLDMDIPLSEDYDLVTLNGNRAIGTMNANADGEMAFNLSLSADLNLNLFSGPDCNSSIQLGINNEDGVSVQSFNSSCITNPSLNIGIGTLHIRNLETPEISYSEDDGWGYRIPWNQDMAFHFERRSSDMSDPSQPHQDPDDEPIRTPSDDPSDEHGDDDENDAVSNEGLEFREREYDENQLRDSGGCISGFFIQPKRFHMPNFVLGWDNFIPASTTVEFPLEFIFDAELRLGCTTVKPRVNIPECLADMSIDITDASYSDGALHAEITTTDLPDGDECFASFGHEFAGGAEYGLQLKRIGGSISGSAGINGFEQQGSVWVETALMAGSPFNCDESNGSTELLTGEMNIRSDGIFEGELSGNIACPLEFGGFSLTVPDASVNFRAGEKGQRAKLTGTAVLVYENQDGDELTSTGNVKINLVTGEIEELELLIEGPFTWGFPQENPFMEFELDEARINRQGLQVTGTHSLIIRDESIEVVFDDLLVGFNGRIQSGTISTVPTVALAGGLGSSESDSPVSIDFGIRLSDDTVPEDLAAGFLINLESPIVVDSEGISLDGSAEALLRFGTYTPPPLSATMEQFTLAFNSPAIAGGQIELFLNTSRVALIDAEGFHPTWEWLEELIPERLMLPTEDVAWLDLRNEQGEFAVDYSMNDDGLVQLATKEGMSLVFGAPILQGLNVETPQWEVTLDNVAIEQGSFMLRNGVIRAGIPQGSDPIDLTPIGIPLAIEEFRFERVTVGDSPVNRLYASGEVMLFGRHFGESATAEVWFDGAGTASGSISIENADVRIPLIPDMELALAHILVNSLNIDVNVSFGAQNFAGISLGFDGALELDLGEETAYSVPMDATWNNGGNFILNVDYEEALGNLEAQLDFDFGYLRAENLHSVWLEYSLDDGFDFEIELDLRLGFLIREESDEESGIDFDLPLRSLTISPQHLIIPEIVIPQLNIPALEVANASIRPVAFRTGGPVLIELNQNWYDGLFEELNPQIDLEIKLPQFAENTGSGYQALSQAALSVYNAGWSDGILTGQIEEYTFGSNEQGLQIPVGQTGASLLLKTAFGSLDNVGNTQGFSVKLNADLVGLPGFDTDTDDEDCTPSVELEVASGRYLSGEITGFTPCGTMELGPLGLQIANSSLRFEVAENGDQWQQELILAGDPTLLLPGIQEGETILITGTNLELDIINRSIRSGGVSFTATNNHTFRWDLPNPDNPFISLQVHEATLNRDGFTISGASSLMLGEDVSVDAQLNNLLFDLETFRIAGGELVVGTGIDTDTGIRLEVGLHTESYWTLTPTGVDPPETTHLSAEFIGGLTVNQDGISVSGAASGSLNIEGMNVDDDQQTNFPNIDIGIQDHEGPFRIEFREDGALLPVRLASGQINLIDGETGNILAYYNRNGLSFNPLNIIAGLLPDVIPLPDVNIAYLETGNISEESDGDNRRLTGSGISLVITAFADEVTYDNDNIEEQDDFIQLTITDLDISFNNTYTQIIEVTTFEVDLSGVENVLDERIDLPIKVTGFGFELIGSEFELSASADIDLPQALLDALGIEEDDEANLSIDNLVFNQNGFRQAELSVGNYIENYSQGQNPLIENEIIGGNNMLALYGAKISIGQENSAAFSGYFDMDLMEEDGNRNPVFFKSVWEYDPLDGGSGSWDVMLGFDDDVKIPVGFSELKLTEAGGNVSYDGQGGSFSVYVSGGMTFDNMLGEDFILSVERLTFGIGPDPFISVDEVALAGSIDQNDNINPYDNCVTAITNPEDTEDTEVLPTFTLFGGVLEGCLEEASASFENNALRIGLKGDLGLLGHAMRFETLEVGTDLHFAIDAELVNEPFPLLPLQSDIDDSHAWVNQLSLAWNNLESELSLSGEMGFRVPDPVGGEGAGSINLVQRNGVTEVFTAGGYYDPSEEQSKIPLGDLFQFEVVRVGANIDFLNFDESLYYSYANLYLEQEEDGSFKQDSRVRFGDPSVSGNYGISFSVNEGLRFNAIGDNITVKIGFFELFFETLKTIDIEDSPFALEMSGSLSLELDGVEGQVNYTDFQIKVPSAEDLNPVHQWPVFQSASLTIMNLLSLSLGTYDYQVGGTIELAHGDDPEEIEYETVPVSRYLRFYNVIEGESALELTVDGLFSGGVEEVLFYQRSDNNAMRMLIQNAHLSIDAGEDLVSLSLTLNYETDGAGGIALLAAGSGQFAGNGFAAVGNFSTLGGVTRMGLFIAATFTPAVPLIPQAPPVIGISGFGGGFFWRPEGHTVDAVFEQVGHLGMSYDGVAGPPQTDDNTLFAAFLYSRFDMLGQGGFYAMQGNLLLTVTNQLMQVNASGSLLMQDAFIKANLSTTLAWSTTSIVLDGKIYTILEYPFIDGSGGIDYRVAVDVPQKRIVWGLNGYFDAKILEFTSSGSFSVAPAGFFADMTVQAELNLSVINAEGNLYTKVWMIPDLTTFNPADNETEIGALAEMSASVSVAGFEIAGVDIFLAYFQEGITKYNLMGYGSGYLGVSEDYGFSYYAYINIIYDNGSLDWDYYASKGDPNQDLIDLIANAQEQADQANSAVAAGLNALRNFIPVYQRQYTPQELLKAGMALQLLDVHEAAALMQNVVDIEVPIVYAGGVEGPYYANLINGVLNQVILEGGTPSFAQVEDSRTIAEEKLDLVQDRGNTVMDRLSETTGLAVRSLEKAILELIDLVDLLNPVTDVESIIIVDDYDGFTVESSAPFEVDDSEMQNLMDNVYAMEELQLNAEETMEKDEEFRASITDAYINLMEIDDIIENQLLDMGVHFGEAFSATQKMYAELAAYHWRSYQRFEYLTLHMINNSGAIRGTAELVTSRLTELGPGACTSLAGDLGVQVSNKVANCIRVLKELTIMREALIKLLAADSENGSDADSCSDLAGCIDQVRGESNAYTDAANAIDNFSGGPFTSVDHALASGSDDSDSEDSPALSINETIEESIAIAEDFWYWMTRNGVFSLGGYHEVAIDSLNSNASKHLGELIGAYTLYTAQLDYLFVIKSQMTETLYSMMDAYRFFHQSVDWDELDKLKISPEMSIMEQESDSPDRDRNGRYDVPLLEYADIEEIQQELAQWLQPPVIATFDVTTMRPGGTIAQPSGSPAFSIDGMTFEEIMGPGIDSWVPHLESTDPETVSMEPEMGHVGVDAFATMDVIPSHAIQSQFSKRYSENTINWSLVPPDPERLGYVALSITDMSHDPDQLAAFPMGLQQFTGETGGHETIETEPFLALGKKDRFTFYSHKLWRQVHAHDFEISLRVRSRAGVPVSRFGEFTAIVSSEDESYSDFYTSPITNSFSFENQEAPEVKKIELPGAFYSTSGVSYHGSMQNLTVRATTEATTGEFARFEVRVSVLSGSGPNQTGMKWSALSGVRVDEANEITITGTFHDIELSTGTYEVLVRAVGVAGNTSNVMAHTLHIDDGKPQFTGSMPENAPGHSVRNATHSVSGTVVSGIPSTGRPAFVPVEAVNPSDYTRNIRWRQAETGLSGLKRYEVVVSDSETPTSGMFSSANAIHTSSTQRRMNLPFGRRYLHVRALSRAGIYSETETYVLHHPDPTPPSTPAVMLQPRNNGFRIYLPQQSTDPETGIAGYQYRITNMSNMQVLKDWPEERDAVTGGISVDFAPGQLVSGSQGKAPYRTVYRQQLGLESGQTHLLHVEIRAVNGDNNFSGTVHTRLTLQPSGTPHLKNWVVEKKTGLVDVSWQGLDIATLAQPSSITQPAVRGGNGARGGTGVRGGSDVRGGQSSSQQTRTGPLNLQDHAESVTLAAKIVNASDAVSGIQTLRFVVRDAITNEIISDQYHSPGSSSGQLPYNVNHQFSYGSASLKNRGSVDVTLTIENGQGVSKSWNESVLINEEVVNNTPSPRLRPRLHYGEDGSISQIDFYWDDGEHPYVDRYRLYRGHGESDPEQFTRVSTALPIREQPHTLINPEEREFFFLTAENQFGVETPLNEVRLWSPDPESNLPVITKSVYHSIKKLGSSRARVTFEWQSSGDIHGYALFRVGADGRHNLIRILPPDITTLEVEMTSISSSYVVRAVTANGNYGPPGNIMEINLQLLSEATP